MKKFSKLIEKNLYYCLFLNKVVTLKRILQRLSLRKNCTYSEFFSSVFSRIRTEYGEIRRISPYLVRLRKNKDQKISKSGHFSRSGFSLNYVKFFTRDFL